MQHPDLSAIVNLHICTINHFFLTCLGPHFLRELYAGIMEDPAGIAYVVETQDKILGFVAGTDQPNGFYKRLLYKQWWRFGLAAIPAYIRKPSILPRLLRAVQIPSQPVPADKCGTLMSIAVDPAVQNQGVGKKLVHTFLMEAQKRGLEYVNLTTDACDNEGVNAFYKGRGFILDHSYTTPEGRMMNEYLYPLTNLKDYDHW
jgi:ribosomal protein S18 acetylase RimI-like enzyme